MPIKKKIDSEDVSLYGDPVRYCRDLYTHARERNDALADINRENRGFYEGRDKKLEERESDPRVARSGLFVHELTPAINTRLATYVAALEEEPEPIKILLKGTRHPEDAQTQASRIQTKLNEQLRESGYLMKVVKEHLLGSEIYRTPSTVLVAWEHRTSEEPEVSELTLLESAEAAARRQAVGQRVKWKTTEVGQPYARWIQPDEFLYDEHSSDFGNDCPYCCQVFWLTDEELKAEGKLQGWDRKEIEKAIWERRAAEGEDVPRKYQTHVEEVQEDRDTPFEEGYINDRWMVCKHYIIDYEDSGIERTKLVVTLANWYKLTGPKRIERGVRFPFVPITKNNLPGTLDSLSSVDIGRGYQGLNSELWNSWLDGISYRNWPPLKKNTGNSFKNPPIWGLGRIWELEDIDGLQPLVTNPGPIPEHSTLIQAVAGKLRNVLNAEDVQQGIPTAPYEKATKTKLRALGAEKRSIPEQRLVADAIIGVAWLYVRMNQNHADDAVDWVLPMQIDVPALTRLTDPENEKQEAILLVSALAQLPLYQTPLGKIKFRNALHRMVKLFVRHNVDDYVPTTEEMEAMVYAEGKMEMAMFEKQAIAQQVAGMMAQKEQSNAVSVQNRH